MSFDADVVGNATAKSFSTVPVIKLNGFAESVNTLLAIALTLADVVGALATGAWNITLRKDIVVLEDVVV